MVDVLINVPKTAQKGAVVEIKVLISHPMETGFRAGPDGKVLPRDIIQRFTCTYEGEEVFRADLYPSTAANPYLSFTTRAVASGTLVMTWTGDNGFAHTEQAAISVA